MTLPPQWLQIFMTCVLVTKRCHISIFLCAKKPPFLVVIREAPHQVISSSKAGTCPTKNNGTRQGSNPQERT
jgi:hypothetical protein